MIARSGQTPAASRTPVDLANVTFLEAFVADHGPDAAPVGAGLKRATLRAGFNAVNRRVLSSPRAPTRTQGPAELSPRSLRVGRPPLRADSPNFLIDIGRGISDNL